MSVFAVSAIAVFAYMTLLYVISIMRSDNGTADIGYGIGVIVSASAALLYGTPSYVGWVIYALIVVWGVRLAVRIGRKNWGKPEDFRYKAWRESWGSTFLVRSYFQIYMLQGLVIYIVSLPALTAFSMQAMPWPAVAAFGAMVWGIGFFFEAVGDYELDSFIRNPLNKGKIMTEGLWQYTRHPNYFGESLMWWGLAIIALSVSSWAILAFASPLLITFLLVKVSGIPMLEKKWEGNPEWEAYKARTSAFIPLPPRA